MKTESTIFDDLNKSLNCTELIDNALGVLVNDPISIKNFALQILNMPMMIRDAFYWKKFFMFLSGVKSIQDELHESTLLSNKLFDNPKSKENNGMRLLFYIDKADSKQKIKYYINVTRSLLTNSIDNKLYFRIIKAISDTLTEDLEYLSEIAERFDAIQGNVQILALERSGLVLQAGLDYNKSIENQDYYISHFGRNVDRYAISLENENRQSFYTKNTESVHYAELGIHSIEDEDIKALMN